jgi:hypothetical protein
MAITDTLIECQGGVLRRYILQESMAPAHSERD